MKLDEFAAEFTDVPKEQDDYQVVFVDEDGEETPVYDVKWVHSDRLVIIS